MIISQDNIYVQTIIYGLIWGIVCFLFYNVAKDNNKDESKNPKENNKNKSNIKFQRILIPEKYQFFAYPIISFIFSSSVFLTLKIISEETGVDYQKLIPSVGLILLVQCACFAFYWISLFNKKYPTSYFLSSLIFVTVLYIYFALINLNENNYKEDNKINIKFDNLSKKPVLSIVIAIIVNFYLCIISMIHTLSENKKGFLSYFGEALMKVLNVKNPNQECPNAKDVKKKN